MVATDTDTESVIRYSLDGASLVVTKHGAIVANFSEPWFEIDAELGDVRTSSRIDREVAARVHLRVVATDVAAAVPQTGTATLAVDILDVNDKPPVFGAPWRPDSPQVDVSVMEEAPLGTLVATVTASDPESGIARYEISGSDAQYFEIGERTGNAIWWWWQRHANLVWC
ncbi:PREDICTED: cadherin-87A-like [Priapulus caudatus]|uniref:Cadherin-87A-like n=1 Tax=Priapulus caudatus TaxID=37621 RepID=A0ABM1F452_PRICU|nr:PREDICTED: cadherin-87A-like [Priapulus caudatus]